ncbi:hypothetical protein [Brevibacillus dissolubilis]|uniref:hypothetical protein n=1 Tax=Brevibacillus dissolubilis TaxID=1844116 RepID=UPI001115D507|nr:hypothetical protein [Brevibacillus dissolubilis]
MPTDSPAALITTYYQTISNRNFDQTLALYDPSSQPLPPTEAEKYAKNFQHLKSVSLHQILGVQTKQDLAHAVVIFAYEDQMIPQKQYQITQFDLVKQDQGWRIVSPETLPEEKRNTLIELWTLQKKAMNENEELRKQIEWVQEQNELAVGSLPAIPVQVVKVSD